MNTTSSPSNPLTECQSKLNRFARDNPAGAVLAAIGCGLAVGLLIRALQPRPAETLAARLLADIQDRLHSIAAPVQRHAEDLMASGASAVKSGVAQFHDLHMERGLRKLGQRFKNLFR